MRVQLFGERCSGTNFVQLTVEANSDALFVSDYGYKHSRPVVRSKTVDLVIVVSRHAFTWVRSLYRNPWGAERTFYGLDFDQFLRTPWQVFYDDYSVPRDSGLVGAEMLNERDENGELYANVLRMRSGKYRNWLALAETHELVVCRLEDWQADPSGELRKLAEGRFQVNDQFRPVTDYKGTKRFGPFVPRVDEPLTVSQVEWIMWELDLSIEEKLGYRAVR